MEKKCIVFCLVLMIMFTVFGCGIQEDDTAKVEDLDFTVLNSEEIPEELVDIIDERKEKPFQLTYEDGDLYIAVGYGEQKSGGYSIAVSDFYLGKNTVNLHTKLIGPKKSEKVETVKSYPYIVIKTENRQERVLFNN